MSVGPPVVALPSLAILALNIATWALGHGVAGYRAHRLAVGRLVDDGPLLRRRGFEGDGRLYERVRIRAWKDRLPEAGGLFAGGTSKRTLPDGIGRRDALVAFRRETIRAERAHWGSLVVLPLFWLWNPPVGVALMAVYGLAVNAPFIAVQRYNRARTDRILRRREAPSGRQELGVSR